MKRLPIIRHIRWLIWSRRVDAHYAMWAQMGSHGENKPSDEQFLDKIWAGEV
jgi:hypothetical protein